MNTAIALRHPADPEILEVRPLATSDLASLRTRVARDPIKRIRDRHHHIAWLLALGKTHWEIAAECRISPSRISLYLRDPAFMEIVELKRREVQESRREVVDALTAKSTEAMHLAEDEVIRRVKDDPSSIHIRDLNRITTDRMDRFGYGKHTTSDNRNINLNFAANLEAAIARSRKAS